MTTVLTYGSFDLFHIGHLKILHAARALGDQLCVGLSTDQFNQLKGKKTLTPYKDREQILLALGCVDHVFPEISWDQKAIDIQNYRATTLAMGGDWRGKFDHLKRYCDVVYFDRTEGISSSQLREKLRQPALADYLLDPENLELLRTLVSEWSEG